MEMQLRPVPHGGHRQGLKAWDWSRHGRVYLTAGNTQRGKRRWRLLALVKTSRHWRLELQDTRAPDLRPQPWPTAACAT